MVPGEMAVPILPCEANCWILSSFDLFFSLVIYIPFNSLLFQSDNSYLPSTYCILDIMLSTFNLLHVLILKTIQWNIIFFYSKSLFILSFFFFSKQHSSFCLSNYSSLFHMVLLGLSVRVPYPSSLTRCVHMSLSRPIKLALSNAWVENS